jgi:hypothetical protein
VEKKRGSDLSGSGMKGEDDTKGVLADSQRGTRRKEKADRGVVQEGCARLSDTEVGDDERNAKV